MFAKSLAETLNEPDGKLNIVLCCWIFFFAADSEDLIFFISTVTEFEIAIKPSAFC